MKAHRGTMDRRKFSVGLWQRCPRSLGHRSEGLRIGHTGITGGSSRMTPRQRIHDAG